jgi:hypothetical protein
VRPGPLATNPACRFRPPVQAYAGLPSATRSGWLRQVKHGGCRILARKQVERVQFWTRRRADFTDRFARMADAVRGLGADEAMIDGKAVVLTHDRRSDVGGLMTKRGVALVWLGDGVDGIVFSELLAAKGAVVFIKAELRLDRRTSQCDGGH